MRTTARRFIGLISVTCVLAVSGTVQAADAQLKTVRVVYLVSKDRSERADYRTAVERAIEEIRLWYGRQLNGPTFRLHSPVVEVVHAAEDASWFTANPNGRNRDDWGFNNTLAEAHRLLGARLEDPNYVWVVYSDGPGDKGRGTSGFAYLPEDDLLGLIGKHPTQKEPARWVGGLGHELGHAFGLPHPADTVRDADALMWAGFYGKYPDHAYLTEPDKRTLLRSPFFFEADGKSVAGTEAIAEKYNYAGGYFGRLASGSTNQWKEAKTGSSAAFYFEEIKRDPEMIVLKDANRRLTVQIPIGGGSSKWSADDGATWQTLYEVRKE
jgi:hypothetical protein